MGWGGVGWGRVGTSEVGGGIDSNPKSAHARTIGIKSMFDDFAG